MKSEWKECTIADLGEVVSGATPSTKKSENYENGTISWITPKDLSKFHDRYIYHGERNITKIGLKSCSAKMLPKNTILFSSRAPIGYLAIAGTELCTNQGFKSVIPNANTDFLFLYYLLKFHKQNIEHMGSGTTFKEISGNTMKSIKVSVPVDISEQHKIAIILSAIDDKIELNNKINQNLEQQAQAIFKSWFIDFEPFGGVMPDDWKIDKLETFVKIKRGASPRPIQKYLINTGYNWLKISDVTNLKSPFILEIKECIKESGVKKTVLLKKGSLVLSNSATVGIPKILDVDSCIHDGWLYFPESKFSNEYLYLLFSFIKKDLVLLGNGSIFTNLKTDILKKFKVVLPVQSVLEIFQTLISPLFLEMKNIAHKNQKLSAIRDLLLPKLMNGEIDVSKIKI
ncbi:MAG: restriction endonuclease subunit S [Oscillospiraceae bacterium]|nr:restriction endonuclease subunit S [Oscillospiraceae bacterium]